ncbi:MAG: small acid-soluble spore protein Tlp [Firmicutes bacterium]|nr:small acid-soluble spore protein Tlp [Bacillota bacterium]
MKSKPDDRRDNVEKIQKNIDNTMRNIRATNEMIETTHDEKAKKDLAEKNKRRMSSLEKMRFEIADEASAREQGYDDDYDYPNDYNDEY